MLRITLMLQIITSTVSEILVKYGVDLGGQEFLDLATKYDLQENGRFSYTDFLRHFILNLKPQDEPKSLLTRRKIHTPKIKVFYKNFLCDVFNLFFQWNFLLHATPTFL